jgi:hypothetical protein
MTAEAPLDLPARTTEPRDVRIAALMDGGPPPADAPPPQAVRPGLPDDRMGRVR